MQPVTRFLRRALPQWVMPVQRLPYQRGLFTSSVYSDRGTAGSTYRWDGQQYVYNWNTKGLAAGYYYRIGLRLDDGKEYYVNIGLR